MNEAARWEKKLLLKPSALVLALLFAATLVIAYGYQTHASVLPLFEGFAAVPTLACWLGVTLGLYAILTIAFIALDSWAERFRAQQDSREDALLEGSGIPLRSTPGTVVAPAMPAMLRYAAVIFICWLPVLILYFPGTIAADGYWQIDYYWLGEVSPTDIHPPFSTYLLGTLYFAGASVGGTMGGVFLASAVQVVLALATYTCVCAYLELSKLSRKACLAVALFYGLVPLFCNIGFTVFKDSYYLSLFVLFMLALIRTYQNFAVARSSAAPSSLPRPSQGAKHLLLLVVLGLLLCCFRKEAVYLVPVSIIAVALAFLKSAWLHLFATLLAFLLGLGALGALGLTTSAVNDRGVSLEMASIPLQQTARFVRDAPGEVSPEEQEIIDQVFLYDASTPLAEKYDPELSDNVKGFNTYVSTDVFGAYLSTSVDMGLRHPEIYLDAFLHQTYGYYSPLFNSTTYYDQQSSGFGSTEGRYVLEPVFGLPEGMRDFFQNTYLAFWQNMPPFSLFWNVGFAVWVLLFLIACLLRKRAVRALVVFVPTLLVLAFCLISPVNGNLRYAMPLIAALPLLAAFTWQELQSHTLRQEGDAPTKGALRIDALILPAV